MSVPEWINKYEPQKSATEPERIPREELLRLLKTAPAEVSVIDLRGDQERGHITHSLHIPATDIEGPKDVKEKVVDPVLAANPETKTIVIHCNSSRQRASFVGGWTEDYVNQYGPKVKVEILTGGIVSWLDGGEDYLSETTLESSQ